MREKHSPDELFAKEHFQKFLEKEEIDYAFDEGHSDKPDLLFSSGEKRIGCELTMLTVEKLMKWSNSRRRIENDRLYKIIIPYEPHMWIQNTITDKSKKLEAYLSQAHLDECWLLLHCGHHSYNWFYKADDYLLNVFTFMASKLKHDFTKVLFLYRDKVIYDLKKNDSASLEAPKLPYTERGYKTIDMTVMRTTLPNHDSTINLEEIPVAEEISLPLLDQRVLAKGADV